MFENCLYPLWYLPNLQKEKKRRIDKKLLLAKSSLTTSKLFKKFQEFSIIRGVRSESNLTNIQEILGFLTGPGFSNGLFRASCLVTVRFLNLNFIIEVEKYNTRT